MHGSSQAYYAGYIDKLRWGNSNGVDEMTFLKPPAEYAAQIVSMFGGNVPMAIEAFLNSIPNRERQLPETWNYGVLKELSNLMKGN